MSRSIVMPLSECPQNLLLKKKKRNRLCFCVLIFGKCNIDMVMLQILQNQGHQGSGQGGGHQAANSHKKGKEGKNKCIIQYNKPEKDENTGNVQKTEKTSLNWERVAAPAGVGKTVSWLKCARGGGKAIAPCPPPCSCTFIPPGDKLCSPHLFGADFFFRRSILDDA